MSLVHLDATRLFLRRQGWRAGDFDPLQRTKLNLPVKAAELSALLDGGVGCAEITFRTDCAADAIRHAAEQFPGVCVGAGTVINAGQAELALSCGAKFIVSPGFSDEVAAVCGEHSVPYLPGCVTPTEIMHAIDCGITTVKFFPADVYGGLSAIRRGVSDLTICAVTCPVTGLLLSAGAFFAVAISAQIAAGLTAFLRRRYRICAS